LVAQEKKQLLQQIEELLEAAEESSLGRLVSRHRSSDIAQVVELLEDDQRRAVFDVLDRHDAAEVLEKVDEATRSELFELLGEAELTRLVSELDPDDAADILAELPLEKAAEIKGLMQYSEDSAGGIMDPVLISVSEDATIAEAVNKIRAAQIDEDFFSIFVVNRQGGFLGDVRIRLLLTSPEDVKIKQLLNTDTIYVYADNDQEEVENIFRRNDLIVVPVLKRNGKLVGRITADRIIEVAEEEAAEDMYAMAGTDTAELETVSVLRAARIRMTWLFPCLVGTAVTALVLLLFKNRFSAANLTIIYATVVAFAPMIAAISGNAGLQTSAIVVCGLATGDLAAQKLGQVFMREARVALLVALCCGLIGGVVCAFLPRLLSSPATGDTSEFVFNFSGHLPVVFAFGIAMFSAIMVATTLGLFLPFLFRRIGIDPAISSGPLVTTANDSISVAIYMTLTMLLI